MPLFKNNITTLDIQPAKSESRSWMDSPSVPLTATNAWNDLSGGPTASGEYVSVQTAMAISTVYTCVTLLAEAVASLPCRLMKQLNSGRAEATDENLYDLLAFSPNPEMTAFTFSSTIVGCSALTGNAYAQVVRDRYGAVTGLWPLHPLKTDPVRLPDGSLAFKTSDGMKEGEYRLIKSTRHPSLPTLLSGRNQGCFPVSAARETFALAKAAEKFGARWFGNGAHVPSILIHKGPKPDPKAQRELAEAWQAAHGGFNANKQGFLFGDWDVKSIGLSPEDSQFLATRNFQRADIAAMFHLPPSMVGDTSRLSNANHQQQQLSFVVETLRPILVRIEQEINRKLLNSTKLFASFDTTDRLRGDIQSQMQSYALGRQWGFLSVNDIRASLGMNNIGPAGDTFLSPVNMVDSKMLLDPGYNGQPTKNDPEPKEHTNE